MMAMSAYDVLYVVSAPEVGCSPSINSGRGSSFSCSPKRLLTMVSEIGLGETGDWNVVEYTGIVDVGGIAVVTVGVSDDIVVFGKVVVAMSFCVNVVRTVVVGDAVVVSGMNSEVTELVVDNVVKSVSSTTGAAVVLLNILKEMKLCHFKLL
jgi:hypothetical protein